MCGIIAVLRRRSDRLPPEAAELQARLDAAAGALDTALPDLAGLAAAAAALEDAERTLRGVPGVLALVGDDGLATAIDSAANRLWSLVAGIEATLDEGALAGSALEQTNAALVRIRDALWAMQRDRLRTARLVADLAGPGAGAAAIEAYTSIQVAFSALDRLEVRGRDSAGLHLLVRNHGLDLESSEVRVLLGDRRLDDLFRNGAVRTPDGLLSLVYKAAAEIGELGDNTRALRAAVAGDDLLRAALRTPDAEVTVLGHTRWASVGIISQANAHPLNSEERA